MKVRIDKSSGKYRVIVVFADGSAAVVWRGGSMDKLFKKAKKHCDISGVSFDDLIIDI